MICRFEYQVNKNAKSGYMVVSYRVMENGIPGKRITAVGYGLPCAKEVEIELKGEWINSPQYGVQFHVQQYQIITPKTKEGIAGYLSSDLIKGVGEVTARAIVERFGENTFQVIEQEPEKLLEIRGISQGKLDAILSSYHESEDIRELMAFLAPFKVTPKKAKKIQEHFGAEAVRVVKHDPYRLCEVSGFGFLTVDEIVQNGKMAAPDAPMRMKAAIRYVLKEAGGNGHLFLQNQEIVGKATEILNKNANRVVISETAIMSAGNQMVLQDGSLEAERLSDGKSAIYLKECRYAEQMAAYHLIRLMKAEIWSGSIEQELEEVQAEIGLVLSEKQKEAVRKVFSSPVSIITGGPGKGKTTILNVVLKVYERLKMGESILLCAPTGRARKRLSESTESPALTMHKALYLTGDDDEMEECYNGEELEADLIIADEFTMADMWLSSVFFSRIKTGSRLVVVGDVDQLPSVGAGDVFRGMIESGCIPVTVLDIFFRQEKDSLIILNADRMNRGKKRLLYGDDFQFHRAKTDEDAARMIERVYQEEIQIAEGNLDMVQVLSPRRTKLQSSSNFLNGRLQQIANPPAPDKEEWQFGGRIFRLGDKVMQMKNMGDISNGDTGRVVSIVRNREGSRKMTVDFGGIQAGYEEDDLKNLEQAYATSVHKSQGSEYPVVILPVLWAYSILLQRNVYYTGITRAKKRVHLIGTESALARAIERNQAGTRNTLLARRIQREAEVQGYQKKVA